jgi:hypothetical protein
MEHPMRQTLWILFSFLLAGTAHAGESQSKIEVVVHNPDGTESPNAKISLRVFPASVPFDFYTEKDGSFTSSDFISGEYYLSIKQSWMKPIEQKVTLRAGETTHLEVTLAPLGAQVTQAIDQEPLPTINEPRHCHFPTNDPENTITLGITYIKPRGAINFDNPRTTTQGFSIGNSGLLRKLPGY